MPEPLRVPLSELKVNPGGFLESARQRRVLLTRRGKVVGELVPIDEPEAAPIRPLLGAFADIVVLGQGVDVTTPTEMEWDALA